MPPWNKIHQIKISQALKNNPPEEDIILRIRIAAKLRLLLMKLEAKRPDTEVEIHLFNTSDVPLSYVRNVQRRFQMSTGGLYREEINNLNFIGQRYGIEKNDFQL